MPLAGLEALAADLNHFERDPLRGGALDDWPPDARLIAWLVPRGEKPTWFAEALKARLEQIVGHQVIDRLRRCDVCFAWMVARHGNRIRCGPKCHAKVWTRERRKETQRRTAPGGARPKRAQERAREHPKQTQTTQRQPTRERKTPR